MFAVSMLSTAALASGSSAWAQTELSVHGGATGANVFCLQAGKVGSGAFAATFLRTSSGGWEERTKSKTNRFNELTRDDLIVSLINSANATEVEFNFVSKTVRERRPGSPWDVRYVILNASDEAMSKDCVSSAAPARDAEASLDADDGADDSSAESSSKPSGKKASKPSKTQKKVSKPSRKEKSSKKSSKKSKKEKDCFPIMGPDGELYARC